MERIVDTHCHILPEVDDGAQNIAETRQMLREAYDEGIKYIIATPHHHPGRGRKSPKQLRRQLQLVREEAAQISDKLRYIWVLRFILDKMYHGESEKKKY